MFITVVGAGYGGCVGIGDVDVHDAPAVRQSGRVLHRNL